MFRYVYLITIEFSATEICDTERILKSLHFFLSHFKCIYTNTLLNIQFWNSMGERENSISLRTR